MAPAEARSSTVLADHLNPPQPEQFFMPDALGYTIDEASDAMGVSRRTVERWIHDGHLAVFRRGRVVRVPESAIAAFRAQGTVSLAAPAGSPAPRRGYGRGRKLKPGERLRD